MIPKIEVKSVKNFATSATSAVFEIPNIQDEAKQLMSREEAGFFQSKSETDKAIHVLRSPSRVLIGLQVNLSANWPNRAEYLRLQGAKIARIILQEKLESLAFLVDNSEDIAALVTGVYLRLYSYKKHGNKRENGSTVVLHITQDMGALPTLLESIYWARDRINTPPAMLNAVAYSKILEEFRQFEHASVKIYHQKELIEEGFGGILGVNKGSIQPATFTVLSYSPPLSKPMDPIVLVGKGITYDTGGINLKPTGFLEHMKSDMAGSAVAAAIFKTIAAEQLPIPLIALIPATDNRPGQDALVPSDVITMYNGTTVEVMNTDAEGRLVLADALSFANAFNPQLVISLATLTGAAKRTFGRKAMAGMTNHPEYRKQLDKFATKTGERIGWLPFWDDYAEELKSDVADLKNIGSPLAGSITAGKFLEHFTDYPFIHFDMSGVSFLKNTSGYHIKGGTGTGIRLLYAFIESLVS